MQLLLDTHIFLWFVLNDPKLSSQAQFLIGNRDNQRFISIASIWEIAIKQSVGKLSFTVPFLPFVTEQLQLNEVQILEVKLEHLNIIASLPLHHRDPFDRLLIAQAIVENIPIISADSAFDRYPIQRIN